MRWLRLGLLLLTTALGCGTGPAHAPVEPAESPLKTVAHTNRPSLAVIERIGDNENAVAAALSFNASVTWRKALQERIETALAKQKNPYELRAHSHGLVIALASTKPDAKLLSKLESTLRQSLGSGDTSRTGAAKAPKGPQDPCLHMQPGAPAHTPNIGARNLAFAVVGGPAFVELQRTLYEDGSDWKKGDQPFDTSTEQYSFRANQSPTGSLWVALRTPQRDRVLDAASQLGRAGSDLSLRISELGDAWSIQDIHFSDRPLSACLAVQLRLPQTPSRGQLARATDLMRRELQHAIDLASSRPIEHAALRSTQATRAAEASAWLALTQARNAQQPSQTPSVLVTYQGPSVQAAQKELAAPPSNVTPSKFSVHSADYRGQGSVWLALGSACPVEHESSYTSGHTAAALLATANQAHHSDVHLTLWTGRGGPALIARGPALSPGDSVNVSRVMGRALTQALQGKAGYAEAASQLLQERRPQPALELGSQLITGGRPSLLTPIGSYASLTSATDEELQRALGLFLEGPLQIAILSNAGDRQVQRMAEELTSWLPTDRSVRCTAPDKPVGPGEYWVQTRKPDADALLLYPLAPQAIESARLIARWLRSPDGWLHRAVRKPELAASIDAVALGGAGRAALVLALRAPRTRVDPAVKQLRALIRRLAKKPVDWADMKSYLPAAQHLPPRGRLMQQLAPLGQVPTQQSVAAVLKQLTEKQLVIVRPTVETLDSGPAGRSSK